MLVVLVQILILIYLNDIHKYDVHHFLFADINIKDDQLIHLNEEKFLV